MPDQLAPDIARSLEANARGHVYDPGLERICDLYDNDRPAFDRLSNRIKSTASIYRDMREHYRRAVEAGVIADDRGPSAA